MPLILIEMADDQADAFLAGFDLDTMRERSEIVVTLDPSVYVVPGELDDDQAVFAREEDAQAYAATFDPPRDWTRLLICDAETAAQMIGDRAGLTDAEEEAKERATCSTCLARTYRGEECVCENGGDAEDYDEALNDEHQKLVKAERPIQDGDTVRPMEFGREPGDRQPIGPDFIVAYQERSDEGWKLYPRDPRDPDFDGGNYWLDCDVEIVLRASEEAE